MKDELHALDLGADEYLTKPCRKERLLARVSNLLRRYEGRANLLEGPGFLLDEQTYTLYIYDKSVILPKNQGKLLEVFLNHGNEVVSKEKLCLGGTGMRRLRERCCATRCGEQQSILMKMLCR